jgi:hypothetical protein
VSQCRISSLGACTAGLAQPHLKKYLVIAKYVERVDTDGDDVADTRYSVYEGHVVTSGHHDADGCDDDQHRQRRTVDVASVKLSVVKIMRRGLFHEFQADAVIRVEEQ